VVWKIPLLKKFKGGQFFTGEYKIRPYGELYKYWISQKLSAPELEKGFGGIFSGIQKVLP